MSARRRVDRIVSATFCSTSLLALALWMWSVLGGGWMGIATTWHFVYCEEMQWMDVCYSITGLRDGLRDGWMKKIIENSHYF